MVVGYRPSEAGPGCGALELQDHSAEGCGQMSRPDLSLLPSAGTKPGQIIVHIYSAPISFQEGEITPATHYQICEGTVEFTVTASDLEAGGPHQQELGTKTFITDPGSSPTSLLSSGWGGKWLKNSQDESISR